MARVLQLSIFTSHTMPMEELVIPGLQFGSPPHVPRARKKLSHPLHRDASCFRCPEPQHDEADKADRGPKSVRTPHMEAFEHWWRDPDDKELPEPVQGHV